MVSEYRTKHFFTNHGFCSGVRVQKTCTPIPWELLGTGFLLLEPIPVHGFRATHLPVEPAGYCLLPSFDEKKLCHMGFRGNMSRSTLADANDNRDWRIYADFAQVLIHIARGLYR